MTRDLRKSLEALVQQYTEHDTHEDIWRKIRDIALLECETERIKAGVRRDPMERFQDFPKDIDRICDGCKVVDHDKVRTMQGDTRIETRIQLKGTNNKQIYLHCRYERHHLQAQQQCTNVTYQIEFQPSIGSPKEKLLWVQVLCDRPHPSHLPAVCLDNDDEADWSDMEEDIHEDHLDEEEHVAQQMNKRLKVDSHEQQQEHSDVVEKGDHDEGVPDRFTAGINPDALHSLLTELQLTQIDEGTAFFMLMSFDCYEHEWDLVGFVLDSVFGFDGDQDDQEE